MLNINQVLCHSGISESVWKLLESDPDRFKEETRRHFALAMPGWEVVKVTPKERIVWLRKG